MVVIFILFYPGRMFRNFSGTVETPSNHISRDEHGEKGITGGKTSL
jgi:hypothetical protein